MTENNYPRRDFLNIAFGTAGVIAVSETLFVGMRFLAPKSTEGEFGGVFNLGSYDQFPLDSVTPVSTGNFYIVRLEDGGFLAVYRRCTHLGCSVPWDPTVQQFVCPCHGSAFSPDGDVLNSPAPRPLDLFSIEINEDSNVLVDTGKKIEREQVKPNSVVYWEGA